MFGILLLQQNVSEGRNKIEGRIEQLMRINVKEVRMEG